MINLTFPTDLEVYYAEFLGVLVGPMDMPGSYKGSKTAFTGLLQAMRETKGIYGENTVEHDKIDGDFEYQPALSCYLPAPTTQYPQRIKFQVTVNGRPADWYLNCGAARHKGTSFNYETTSCSIAQHRAYHRDPQTNGWVIREVRAFVSNPTVITNLREMRLSTTMPVIPNSTYRSIAYSYTIWDTGTGGVSTSTDWSVPQDYDTIMSAHNNTGANIVGGSSHMGKWYYIDTDAVYNPRTLRERFDMLSTSIFPDRFPINEKPFGDLAVEASESLNANHVNMLAFTKDLRDVKHLAPQLKNLRSLKTASNNYLTVKYGILPTISDLQKIARAFQALKPYVDRNNFNTYSAGCISTEKVGGYTYTLEQHTKLAFGGIDLGLLALINKLESCGTLPTLSNVWDLVRYSFVVDWFIDVGSFLEQLDSLNRIGRYGLRYVTMSRKRTMSGSFTPEQGEPFSGSATWVHYHRWTSDQCPVPGLIPRKTFQGFNHWLESAALIIQRA